MPHGTTAAGFIHPEGVATRCGGGEGVDFEGVARAPRCECEAATPGATTSGARTETERIRDEKQNAASEGGEHGTARRGAAGQAQQEVEGERTEVLPPVPLDPVRTTTPRGNRGRCVPVEPQRGQGRPRQAKEARRTAGPPGHRQDAR